MLQLPGSRPSKLLPQVLIRVLPAAALILVVVWFGAHTYISQTVEAELRGKLNQEAQHGLDIISARLDSMISALEGTAENDLVINALIDYEARQSYIKTLIQSLRLPGPEGGHIALTDYRGRLITANFDAHSASEYFVPGNAQSGPYLHADQWQLSLAVPIYYEGRPEGAIIARYDREAFPELFQSAAGLDDMAVVAGETVIFATGWDALTALEQGEAEVSDYIFVTSPQDEASGLRVVVATPAADALAAVDSLNTVMVLAILLALLSLVGGITWAAFLASKPLERFNEQIRHIGDTSDLNAQVETSGAMEFQRLADTFNDMLERLRTTTASRDELKEEIALLAGMQKELSASEARYRELIEGSASGLFICRGDNIVYANQTFANTFGFKSPNELVGTVKLSELFNVEGISELHPIAAESNGAIKEGGRSEMRVRRTDNEEAWFEVITRHVQWEGEPAVEGSLFDISARKEVERLKNDFISVVSHELRTPLTSLIGSLGLIQTGKLGALPDKVDTLIGIAKSNSERLVSLVNDILDVQKLESGNISMEKSPVAIGELCARALSETAFYGAEYGVTFNLEVSDKDALVFADADRLLQVLINLLSNAAKFSPEGDAVLLAAKVTDDRVRFWVADNGDGIPAALQPQVFSKFFQAERPDKKKRPGTGLGLSICKAIIDQHGGEIGFVSVPGEGTTFHFELPRHREERAPEAGNATARERASA